MLSISGAICAILHLALSYAVSVGLGKLGPDIGLMGSQAACELRWRQAAHLGLDQVPVDAVTAQQRLGRAVLHQAAPLEHQDAVEVAHGGQAMRDRQHGAAAHQAAERLADELLGCAVERGGRLVEQQQRRVLEERARDGDALALSARQPHAAIADDRVEAFGQLGDELAAMGRVRRLPDLVVARLGPGVADVLDQRAVEQRDVLRHDGDGLAQALLRDLR